MSASASAAAVYSAIEGRALLVAGGSAGWLGSSEWSLFRRRTMGPREVLLAGD